MNAHSKSWCCYRTVAAGLALSLTLAGCSGGDENGPELLEAWGTVTLDDEPQSFLLVTFESATNGKTTGLTDENGKYTIEFNDSKSGAFPGETIVSIVRVSPSEYANEDDILEDDEDEDDLDARIEQELQSKKPIPARYNDDTELTVDVKDGGAPYNFDLESK